MPADPRTPEAAWTPEPWSDMPHGTDIDEGRKVRILPKADYLRAVACVDALAGIPDPEGAVRALVEAARPTVGALEHWEASRRVAGMFSDALRAALAPWTEAPDD